MTDRHALATDPRWTDRRKAYLARNDGWREAFVRYRSTALFYLEEEYKKAGSESACYGDGTNVFRGLIPSKERKTNPPIC